MAFDIPTFISNLQFGGARSNQFDVIMPAPAVSIGLNQPDFTFKCKSSQIPPEQIGIIPVSYFGRTIKLAGDRQFPEWNIQVYNDEDFGVRDAFERWSNAINGHSSNLRDAAAVPTLGYMVDAKVNQYGKDGNVIKTYTMVGAWPAVVGGIELSWEQNDAIEIFSVSMAYQYSTSDTTS